MTKQTPKAAASTPFNSRGAGPARTDAALNDGPDILSLPLVSQIREYGIVGVDAQGVIRSWNAGAERLTGFAASELCGKNLSMLYAAAEVAAGCVQQDLQTAAAGEICVERHCVTKTAGAFPAALTITPAPLTADVGPSFLLIFRSLVDQIHNERLTRLMADLAFNALILVDGSGSIVRANAQAEAMFGYSAHELLGKSIEILVPAAVREKHPAFRNHFLRNPSVRAMGAGRELFGRRKDGREFPVEIGLNPIDTDQGMFVLSAIIDISERKRSEEQFRRVVEAVPAAIVMVNESGAILMANLQTERLFGYSRAELLDQQLELLVPESVRARHPQLRANYFRELTARPMGAGRELRGRRRDGSEFPVEIGLTPIETGDGWAVLGTIVDITERTDAQERERLHLAEMAHALRLSTVGEIFSGLAHEVNQPLAAAANYARTCIRYARSEQGIDRLQLLEWMEKSAAQTARAIEIVQRIGTFVRKERSKQVRLDVNSIIRDVIALPGLTTAMLEVASNIIPDLQLDVSLPPVIADRVQVEQVLLNLLRNAIESMAETPRSRRKLSVRTSRASEYAEVAITDAGHGISGEQLAHLFSPFYTTKPDGMGLGLSISRSIIESHAGQMSAESRVGVGTTFRFTLPLATAEAKS